MGNCNIFLGNAERAFSAAQKGDISAYNLYVLVASLYCAGYRVSGNYHQKNIRAMVGYIKKLQVRMLSAIESLLTSEAYNVLDTRWDDCDDQDTLDTWAIELNSRISLLKGVQKWLLDTHIESRIIDDTLARYEKKHAAVKSRLK